MLTKTLVVKHSGVPKPHSLKGHPQHQDASTLPPTPTILLFYFLLGFFQEKEEMDSHCQATEEKLDALICWRELQISFALQMLASSGKYPDLRILNFGRLNFCDGTAATFFSHNPFISCCYYILHFVTAAYFNFFQVSSITSKAIQTRNHTARWQW